MKKFFVIALSLCCFYGCGIYKKYEPTTDTRPAALQQESFNNGVGRLSWRSLFSDPQLQNLIEKALANNTDVRKAHLSVLQMEASLAAAKLGYLPSLGLNVNAQVDGTGFGWQSKSLAIPVALNWQLDIFGRNTAKVRKTKALLEYSRDLEQASRAELIAAVAKAYYSLAMVYQQLAVIDSTAVIQQQALNTQMAMMEAGSSNSAAVSQFSAQLCDTKAQRASLYNQRNALRNQLSLLVNENIQDLNPATVSLSFPLFDTISIPSVNMLCRPDVRAAQRNLEAAFYSTQGAIAEFWPNISISANMGAAFSPASFVWGLAGSLLQPVFQNGALIANLKVNRLQQEQASLDFQKAVLAASIDVSNALSGIESAKMAGKQYIDQIGHYENAYFATTELMKHGKGTYLEVLVALQSLLNARLSAVSCDFDYACSVISLYLALGGGSAE